MADMPLDGRTEFSKRLVKLRNQEHWVVSKTIDAMIFAEDQSMAAPFGGDSNLPLRISESDGADIKGRSPGCGDVGKFLQQFLIVPFIASRVPG